MRYIPSLMNKFKILLRIIDLINLWAGRLTALLMIPMIFIIMWEVIARYGFNSPTDWAFETSLFIFGGFVVLGGGYTLYTNGHVNMDVFFSRLSPRKRAIIDTVTSVFFFLFIFILLRESWDIAWDSFVSREHTWTDWGPPYYPIRMALPVGAFLLLLQGISKFIRDLAMVITGRPL